jgi:hypothetical protein
MTKGPSVLDRARQLIFAAVKRVVLSPHLCTFCVVTATTAFGFALYTIEDLTDPQTLCVCIFVWPVLLILAVGLKLVTTRKDGVRGLLYRATGMRVFAPRNYKNRSDVLTENYVHELNDGSIIALLIVLIVASIAIWMRDTGIIVLSTMIASMLFAHTALTEFRVARGYFGTNPAEASELIAYIAAKHREGDTPPGTRVARAHSPADPSDEDRVFIPAGVKT